MTSDADEPSSLVKVWVRIASVIGMHARIRIGITAGWHASSMNEHATLVSLWHDACNKRLCTSMHMITTTTAIMTNSDLIDELM